jgi:hypothetical protein
MINNKYKNKRVKINFININNYKPKLLAKSVTTEKKEECTICFEVVIENGTTINKDLCLNKLDCYCHCNCKYYIHVHCLRKWITVKPTCLMCKQKIYSFNAPLTIANNPAQHITTTRTQCYRYCCKIVICAANIVMIFSSFYVILYTCFLLFYVTVNFRTIDMYRN